jgi:hypothetical protein
MGSMVFLGQVALILISIARERHFLNIGVCRELSVDNSRRDVCNRGCDFLIGLDEWPATKKLVQS